MAPSADACCFCSEPFYGKQTFLRCVKCEKRAHTKCIDLPSDEISQMKSGVSPFLCLLCSSERSPVRLGCTSPAITVAENEEGQAATRGSAGDDTVESLRCLLRDALEGMSFLTDQLTSEREDNRRREREWTRRFDLQSIAFNQLRADMNDLRRHIFSSKSATATPSIVPTAGGAKAAAVPASRGLPWGKSSSPAVSTLSSALQLSPGASITTVSEHKADPEFERREPFRPHYPSTVSTIRRPLSKGTSKNGDLAAATSPASKRKRALFVTRLGADCRAQEVQTYLELKCSSGKGIKCTRLKTRHDDYSSFHIAIDEDAFDELFSPDLWPEGCLFKEYFGALTESRKFEPCL